jgi:hypothetical protein
MWINVAIKQFEIRSPERYDGQIVF